MIRPKELDQAMQNPGLAHALIEAVGPRVLEIVEAARAKPLNRYNVRPGRIFGRVHGKERYRIIDISGNRIIFKDLLKDRVEYEDVDTLLELWNLQGVVEISPVEDIIALIKKYLSPILGGALVGALITWIMNKVGR